LRSLDDMEKAEQSAARYGDQREEENHSSSSHFQESIQTKGGNTMKYELSVYFDVYEYDGEWIVNNMFRDDVVLDGDIFDMTEKQIATWLKEHNYLKTSDLRKIVVDKGWGDIVEIYQRKGWIPLMAFREALVQ